MREGKRRLVAIMFSDVVGYTSLMAKDERNAMHVLDRSRIAQKTHVQECEGEWLKEMGDGALSTFPSAVDAVDCALTIQRSLLGDPELQLRIGIHIGDVVIHKNDVFGDGVNVASRIVPLAEPGGIVISEQVYDTVRNMPDVIFIRLGEQDLKNVDRPVAVYSVQGVMPQEIGPQHGATVMEIPGGRPQPSTVREEPKGPSIAVLPFANLSPDEGQEYLCDGIAEELINALSHVEGLRVVARTSAFAFKGTNQDVREIGARLDVDNVLEGSVRRSGNQLRVSAQLVSVADGCHVWSQRYDREVEDVFAIQDEISLAIVRELQVRLLGVEHAQLVKRHTEDLDAYKLYLRGRFLLTQRTEEGMREGLTHFEQAIEKDPQYAMAYTGVANCYTLLSFYGYLPPHTACPKARAAAQKALEIDDSLAEAHVSLAGVIHLYDWNWPAAEVEYQRAIELNPQCAPAHNWYSCFLSHMGRHEEAIAAAERAQQLDPLSPNIGADYADILYRARQFDRSIEEFRKTLDMEPGFALGHVYCALPYAQNGMYAEAIAELEKAIELSGRREPTMLALLGAVHSLAGDADEAERLLGELQELSAERAVSPFAVAVLFAALGQTNLAFEWLERGYEQRDHGMVTLKALPLLDGLRSDMRFAALLGRMGLGG